MNQPSLFLSHGAPDVLLSNDSVLPFFAQLGEAQPTPAAIVIISAHWIAEPIEVSVINEYQTIYDFSGFSNELYDLKYPAKGDIRLAHQIIELLSRKGISSEENTTRGLDHGAWIPLRAVYPKAEIPVVAVSLPHTLEACAELGEALQELRQQNVLIIGSGGSVHNLSAINRSNHTDEWALSFSNWLSGVVAIGDISLLIDSTKYPAEFTLAHPSVEHLAPLFVSLAAGGGRAGKLIYDGYMYGNIGMACYQFD
ncbi:DODA-type extradiol aromatic ring-opening family dioxygenase [Neptunomonas japonica]|uniref:DODA-type extradiol aromatic ring-opening family dioxygenase n=1 Tax=Neptunomonas japonica TaxID=417574 RepID=UPI0003FC529D|nr:class III extradiol ring-cleavage dioxygenase [Neptunomonas japonica]